MPHPNVGFIAADETALEPGAFIIGRRRQLRVNQ